MFQYQTGTRGVSKVPSVSLRLYKYRVMQQGKQRGPWLLQSVSMAPRLCQGALILSCDAVITGLTSPIARSYNGSGVGCVLSWRSRRGSTGLSKGRDSHQWWGGLTEPSLDCLVCDASPLIL